jgi:FixJ family two-component response regulator/anti-sigma regulatory factor (Ser/Thr protein kinase)
MEVEQVRSEKHRVLAVDDEPVARQQLAFQIAALGHEVSVAESAAEAQKILTETGSKTFDCLITDCWMPVRTGLDLLLWLRSHDPTLASIVVSKAVDESVVTQTLRGGASDFLKKPAFGKELEAALGRAIASTQRRRRHAATRLAVKEAGLVQRRMNNLGMGLVGAALDVPVSLTICYHPYHDAGGDSVAFFSLDPSRVLVVVADVSGHDLKSAFISAYFQGLLRGMIERNTPASAILNRFNSFLVNEWRGSAGGTDDFSQEITSLAVCSASIDFGSGSVCLLNSGFPLASLVDREGGVRRCGESGGSPLGWFEPNPLTELTIKVANSNRLVIWTDGLEDFANQLQIAEWCLAYRVLMAKEQGQTPDWLASAPDDVLLVVIGMEKEERAPYPFPIMAERYEKGRAEDIDKLQARWQRSLTFAFPKMKRERLSEILLCTREAILNGLRHGCPEDSDCCCLTMTLDRGRNELRVGVADPGPGHRFDYGNRASDELMEGHRGLLLIHGIPDRVQQDESGARLEMFFPLERESKEE